MNINVETTVVYTEYCLCVDVFGINYPG